MKDLLKEYNKKRDFRKTREPGIKKALVKKNKKLIFVVQEHHARRLHYDFRLELQGVLKSWAVPKGPSLDPAHKRLAVQTEDHPLSYADFHGTIPEGEYGGGEVFIWDTGTWESLDADPLDALERGRLEFTLRGTKLKGKFILIRTKGRDDKKNNWLLIKRHDEKVNSSQSKLQIGKDPWPGFIAPQLPKLVNATPEDEGSWLHEMKYDGYRMQAHIQNGIVHFYTRNGHDWSNKFPFLLKGVGQIPVTNAIFDGEIVALDEKGRSHFQRLQNSLKSKKDAGLRYYVFDLLFLNGKDLRQTPLLERKSLLEEILEDAPENIVFSEHFMEQGRDFYQVSCEHDLEGIVSKMIDAPYASGRNDLWVKAKCTSRQEFVIGGWTEPKGGRSGLGALLLGFYEEGELRYAGKVGTGFDTKMLKYLKKILTPLERKTNPFKRNPPQNLKDQHWVTPQKIAEVSFANWTDEKILRAPVFVSLREDKAAKDIGLEVAADEKKLRLVTSISSPQKLLFKEEGITKKDVADYYQVIAPHMLPYFANRPLSLVRCPNGPEGTCFYQKHINGKVPPAFHTFAIKEGDGEGIYLSIDSVEGLLELVQLNAFEIHAWNCHRDHYLWPDQIVMDFDPGPEVQWSRVIEGAFELKELLEDLNLQSFVKLTGGKGVHIHIPIAPQYSWTQVKSFSHTLALELVSRHPESYTANMSKKMRKNKIFVDYLRNGFGATAVIPYSLRARSISSVALPLEWNELKNIKDPQEMTLKKVLTRLKKRKIDPWKGMLGLDQEIDILKPVKQVG
jgi:bifunctional non-homologous end joining protein LigD